MQPKEELQTLTRMLKAGDESAFERIYHLYKAPLFHFAFRYLKDKSLAEDALQDVFVKLWKASAGLDEKLTVKGFLFTCMKHHVLNLIRSEQNRIKKAALYHAEKPLSSNNTQQSMALDESISLVEKGMQTLSEGKKKICRLSIIEGYSNQEIASLLNLSEHTVRSQLSQSNKLLREYLNKIVSLLFAFIFMS